MNKKILLVGPVPPPYGGIPTYVKSLSESALKERYDLILFNTAVPPAVRSFDTSVQRGYLALLKSSLYMGMKLIAYATFSLITFAYNLIKRRPQVVHIFSCTYWGFWRNAFYVLFAKFLGRKVIFHILGAIDIFYSRESGYFVKFFIRKTLDLADLHIVQSPNLRDFVNSITKKKVIAIFNGVDFNIFKYKMNYKEQLRLHKNGKAVLTVGALGDDKGTYNILKAIPLVIKNDSEVIFYFVGRGNISKFTDISQKQGIEKHVKLLGAVSDDKKIKLYLSSGIFILPSYKEGQPISIIEAMAAGLPVVSTTVGSIPEIIREGENGFLIEPGDYKGLAEKIIHLLRNDEIREKIGKINYETAREKYDVRRVYKEIAEVYDSFYYC
jgi:glycosyltransferase involved in cell wall biosynthesis